MYAAGMVHHKEYLDSVEAESRLFDHLPEGMPEQLVGTNFDLKRQWYLYNEVREFCDMRYRDIVCPKPQGK